MGQHRQLAEEVAVAIRSFEYLVLPKTPSDPEALTKARVTLVQCVNRYIGHFGSCVSAQPAAPAACRWKTAYGEVVELRQLYSAHIARFSAATMHRDWDDYRASCHRLVTAMRGHLSQVTQWDPLD